MASLAGHEFASLGDTAYLDTPTQGVAPTRSVAVLNEALSRWESGEADWQEWEREAEAARIGVASLMNCRPMDVALIPSVVSAAATVAAQLPRGRILVSNREYRSNLLPWLAQRTFGREVAVLDEGYSSGRLIDEIDDRTALVAISSVQSADGARVDLDRIVSAAHDRGALVFVDATQSLGVVGLDTATTHADFVAAAGYKWLLGGRGTGYFYVRPELQTLFEPVLASPMSAVDVLDGQSYGVPYVPFDDARRFDQSLAWLSWVAARPSIDLLVRIGVAALEDHSLQLASDFRAGCAELGYEEKLSATELPSPIVSLAVPDPEGLQQRLLQRRIRTTVRSTGVRLGFHLYNDDSQVERALGVLAEHRSAA